MESTPCLAIGWWLADTAVDAMCRKPLNDSLLVLPSTKHNCCALRGSDGHAEYKNSTDSAVTVRFVDMEAFPSEMRWDLLSWRLSTVEHIPQILQWVHLSWEQEVITVSTSTWLHGRPPAVEEVKSYMRYVEAYIESECY